MDNEIRDFHELDITRSARIALLIALTVFTIVLIVENIMMGWEIWVIPLLTVTLIGVWVVYIYEKLQERGMILLLTSLLMLETFYYAAHCENVFRVTPIAIVAVMLYALSMDRNLVICGISVGYASILFRLFQGVTSGEIVLNLKSIFIIVVHTTLLLFAGFVSLRFMTIWKKMYDGYLERMAALAEERDKINDFLTNISHEIRTPVNAVIGMSKILERNKLPAELHGDVLKIRSAGTRIADELGDILDYTEIDTNRLVLTEEPYMMASLVNDILSEFSQERRSICELIMDVDPKIPSVLVGDMPKLKKILRHLIENGLKFTAEGCVYVRIGALRRDYGINLLIQVTDTGIGMDEDVKDHLSERFYKLSAGRTRSTGGLGIGLPIVSGFVRMMNGFMRIETQPDCGTSVFVSLPQQVSDDSPCMSVSGVGTVKAAVCIDFNACGIAHVREYYRSAVKNLSQGLDMEMTIVEDELELVRMCESGAVTHIFIDEPQYRAVKDSLDALAERVTVIVITDSRPEMGHGVKTLTKPFCPFTAIDLLSSHTEIMSEDAKINLAGVKAMVVDDEPTNLMVAEGLLLDYGLEIFTAESGKEAIGLYEAEDIPIVFMDHMMPEMDGIETARRLRTMEKTKGRELYIIALTANTVSSAKELFRQEGFDGFLAKPLDTQELERVLKKVLPRSYYSLEKVEIAPKSAKTSSPDMELASLGVDVSEGIGYCANDREFYEKVLRQYADTAVQRMSELETMYDNGDWPNYAIRVHALKSTSKMIGAGELSDLAKRLEDASRAGNGAAVTDEHRRMMDGYKALTDAINRLYPPEAADTASDGGGAELIEKLVDRLEDYDSDASLEIFDKLNNVDFGSEKAAELIKSARELAEDFDMSAAAEAAKRALDALRGEAEK